MEDEQAPPPAEAPQEDGPLSSRIESKLWKTRMEAYVELAQVRPGHPRKKLCLFCATPREDSCRCGALRVAWLPAEERYCSDIDAIMRRADVCGGIVDAARGRCGGLRGGG
jgi:hypothetical protein